MEWNNGKQQARFERKQKKLREEYLAAGMTEEQMKSLYEFDKDNLVKERREADHTQGLDLSAFDDDGDDEAKNPLYKKFLDKFTVVDNHFTVGRYDWIEEIEDERIYKAIKSLSVKDLEILTLLVFDGYSQTEIAKKLGKNQSNISRRIMAIKNILNYFC